MSTVSLEVVKALVKLFVERFDNNELEDLAFSLGVNFDDISGNTRSAKARELALYLNRRSLMDELRQKGPVERPDLDWEAVFGGVTPPLTAGITGPEPPARGPQLDFRDIQKLGPILAAHTLFQTPDGRQSLLYNAGLSRVIHLDLNGNAYAVASSLLAKVNEYGEIEPGDTAIGRLLAYVAADPALPPADKSVIAAIAARNAIKIE